MRLAKALTFILSLSALGLVTSHLRSTTTDASATLPAPCVRGTFKNTKDAIPPGWSGPIFQLSQDYPEALPSPENYPWKTIDYKTDPMGYMMAVRKYVFEGNVNPANPNAPWVVQNNPVRKWYHAPWMDAGDNGREFISGMTRELASAPGQLWKNPPQSGIIQNWAVGFYNPPGGFTFGQVWCNPQNPSLSTALFPEGTVAAKLLFSAAPLSQVPFLSGSVRWTANINTVATNPKSPRTPKPVRLLQIDVAVRDASNTDTGWNFGTFIFNPASAGAGPWDKMQPVGLMWGDDPGVTPTSGTIKQSWLNPAVANLMQHYGWAERLNGPVDNPLSSCLSCHATAGWPPAPLIPPSGSTDQQRLPWFRNVKAGEPFRPGQASQDYSLQLTFGIRNFKNANPGGPQPLMARRGKARAPEVGRAGGSEEQFRRDVVNELAKRKRKYRQR